jgi:hypothetical protein
VKPIGGQDKEDIDEKIIDEGGDVEQNQINEVE